MEFGASLRSFDDRVGLGASDLVDDECSVSIPLDLKRGCDLVLVLEP